MARIIFDSFEPADACLERFIPKPSQVDKCQVKVTFHLEGDDKPDNPFLIFQRAQDKFMVDVTRGQETNLGFLRSSGFSETDPSFQGKIFYSIGLTRWLKNSYKDSMANYSPPLLPLVSKMQNFVISGSIESKDPQQSAEAANLLRQILQLPPEARKFFTDRLNSLNGENSNVIDPSMRPRVQWLADLTSHYDQMRLALSPLKEKSTLGIELENCLLASLVFLGTGMGDWAALKKDLGRMAVQAAEQKNIPDDFRFLAAYCYSKIHTLEEAAYFKENPEAKQRMENFHSDLFRVFMASRLQDAADREFLGELVEAELLKAHLKKSWLQNPANLSEIAETLLPSFKLVKTSQGTETVQVDVHQLKIRIGKLANAHGIQEREFMIGALAFLRYTFGRDPKQPENMHWADKSLPMSMEISEGDQKELFNLRIDLERKVASSFKKTNIALPLLEGGLCALGLGVGALGISKGERNFTVAGSTVTGMGCGAMLTHLVFRTRNPYLWDSVGGASGAAAAFLLSFFLTGLKSSPSTSPIDVAGRNPTTGYGP